MYDKNFIFEATTAARKSLEILEESNKYKQPTVGADQFNETALETKLSADGKFLLSLGDSLEESEQCKYFDQLSILLEGTQDLFIEVNMKPRTCSHAVDTQELTESVTQEIYSKNFTDAVNKNFALPLFEGTLLQDHKAEAKLLTEAAVAADLTKEMNTELFLKYALFENALFENTYKMILPEALEERTSAFINAQDKEYFEVFDKNAKALLEVIQESTRTMVSMIAPKLFEESAGLKESGCAKFAGISAALKTV